MLMHIDIKNNTGNCLAQDSTRMLNIKEITNVHAERNRDRDISVAELQEKIDIILPTNFDEFTENIIAYIAGFVVKSLKRKVSCETCLNALCSSKDEQNTYFNLISRKSRGGLLYPSKSVFIICQKIEKIIKNVINLVGGLPPKDILITLLLKESSTFLLDPNIFSSLAEHVFDYTIYENSHEMNLIESIIRTYSLIRSNSAANKINANISGEKIRKQLSKLVLFRHQ